MRADRPVSARKARGSLTLSAARSSLASATTESSGIVALAWYEAEAHAPAMFCVDESTAEAIRRAPVSPGKIFVVNLSGRGDKDIDIYRENFPEMDHA